MTTEKSNILDAADTQEQEEKTADQKRALHRATELARAAAERAELVAFGLNYPNGGERFELDSAATALVRALELINAVDAELKIAESATGCTCSGNEICDRCATEKMAARRPMAKCDRLAPLDIRPARPMAI